MHTFYDELILPQHLYIVYKMSQKVENLTLEDVLFHLRQIYTLSRQIYACICKCMLYCQYQIVLIGRYIIVRIAICDDDESILQRLSDAISEWAESRKVQVDVLCYTSAESFLMKWMEVSHDLAFLDIKMKGMTGIELAEHIRKTDKNMMIVFVTSFKQYVLKGYDVGALHYLIKPLSMAKLLPILDKANTIWRSRNSEVLLVSNGTGQMKLPFDEIFCISMLSHMAKIQVGENTFELRKTAEELANMLPYYFVRCHRSYIVNLFKVDCVYKDSLLLSNGESLPISRNRSKDVNDAFVKLHTER